MDSEIESANFTQHQLLTNKEKVTLDSFSMISVIGKGSYAEVILARKKDT